MSLQQGNMKRDDDDEASATELGCARRNARRELIHATRRGSSSHGKHLQTLDIFGVIHPTRPFEPASKAILVADVSSSR